MSIFFPQGGITLKVLIEDYKLGTPNAQSAYSLNIQAKNLTVNINDYTQADTFNCEVDFSQFPFDPRLIRSCSVSIHMQDMKGLTDANGKMKVFKPSTENAIFLGFVDENSIEFNDTTRTVKLEGRDYTSLFIDKKYLGGPIDLAQPLETILNKFLSEIPENANAGIKLDNRTGETLPTLGASGESLDPKATLKNTAPNSNYWDEIQKLCTRAALIVFIDRDKLVVSKPRILKTENRKTAPVFAYGKNLKSLSIKRKLGRLRGFNLIVRSTLIGSKKVEVVALPQDGTAEWSKATGIPNETVYQPSISTEGAAVDESAKKPAPAISYSVPGVADIAELIKIGESVYEEMGTQEIEGSFETMEMTVADGQSAPKEFELLKLRNGSPVAVYIDQGDLREITALESPNLSKKRDAEIARYLKTRNYPDDVAAAISKSFETMKYHNVFYTKAVEFSLSADRGFSVKVDFMNFIEASQSLGGK